ncbi:MAG: GAF domain-containing protein [Chloroflexi bacterium]|nr:GAF domain-containing protein [Chloroflexota bacterium]
MTEWSAITLGVGLAGFGLILWVIARFFLEKASRTAAPPVPFQAGMPLSMQSHQDAILLVHPGGKLGWLNPKAHEVFRIPAHETPNLERLARGVRPGEALLNLCASETRGNFALNGKLVEGVSYWLGGQTEPVMVVALRFAGVNASEENGGEYSFASLQTMIDLSREMNTRLGINDTLQAVMESFEKLLATDFLQICVWEKSGEVLIPYLFSGFVEGERKVEQLSDRYLPGDGNPGFLVKTKTYRFFSTIDENTPLKPVPQVGDHRIESYIGLPLLHNGKAIGTLELGSLQAGQFKHSDVELIRLLSGQAGVAVYKAQQYELQKRRAEELGSLVDLSRAFSSMRDPKEVFGRLLENIVPLVDVQILGFLIYNENDRLLSAQVPFYGLPPQVAAIYSVQITANSAIEKTLLDQDVLYSDDATSDPRWETLGLDTIARAASIRETVLIPLMTGGKVLGYLQAANHKQAGAPFSNDELHLLTIVSNQVAPIIENSALVQQTRLRAQRAEALRRIASLASSDANRDEILSFAVRELTNLIHPDVTGIFLVDSQRERLAFHRGSYYGQLPDLPRLPQEDRQMLVTDVQYPFTVTGSQRVFQSGDLQEEATVIPFYQRVIEALGLRSAVVVPMVVRNDGIGEIWLGSRTPGFFNKGDLQAVVTVAGQLASVVEQSYLVEQTDENLRRRVEQVSAIDRINRALAASQDLPALMEIILQEMVRAAGADNGTLMVFDLQDQEGGSPVVQFSVGEAHPVGFAAAELEALSGSQAGARLEADAELQEFFGLPVESLLLLPISVMREKAGLVVLHGKRANQFDQTSLEIAQSLAAQASVVLRSAEGGTGFFSAQPLVNRLPDVTREWIGLEGPQAWFARLADDIRDLTPFQMVLFSQYDAHSGTLQRVFHRGLPDATWQELSRQRQPWKSVEQLFKKEYQHGAVYFLPFEGELESAEGLHTVTPLPSSEQRAAGGWHAEDLLVAPVRDPNGEPLGLISLDAPRDGKRPNRQVFDVLNLAALQLGFFLQSQKRGAAAPRLGEETPGRDVGRYQKAQEILEKANRQMDLGAVLQGTARELMDLIQMDAAVTAIRDAAGVQFVDALGDLPEGVSLEALFGQRNPLRQTLQEGDVFVETDLAASAVWQKTPLLRSLGAASFLSLPLRVSEEVSAGILLTAKRTLSDLSLEDRDLLLHVTRQVSVTLQNLYLTTETRRRLEEVDILLEFTRKISNLDPQAILETLVTSAIQAIPGAKAGWAAVWKDELGWLEPAAARGYRDNASLLQIRYRIPEQTLEQETARLPLPIRVYLSRSLCNAEEVDFSRDYHLSADDLMRYRQATGGPVPLSCLAAPLSVGESNLGVVLLDNFEMSTAFTRADEAVFLAFCRQAALALENARLFISTEQRAAQLQSLTRAAGALSTTLQRNALIDSILDLLGEVVPYDTATLWLRSGERLVVAAERGFNDTESRVGLSVEMEDSRLFQDMVSSPMPLVVGDVRKDERFPALLEPEHLSWMGVPLSVQSELTGVIALEKHEARFYQPEHIHASQTVASQAAVALENASLYEESLQRSSDLDQRTRRLSLLNRFSGELGALLHSEQIYALALKQIGEALQADRTCLVTMPGECAEVVMESPADLLAGSLELPASPLLAHLKQSLGVYNQNQVGQEKQFAGLVEAYLGEREVQSLLMVPLAAGENFYGWVWGMRKDDYRFTPAEMELARTICNQAAISLQKSTLYEETRNFSITLEEKVRERTEELYREHLNAETLLRLSEELSRSLDMSEVITRAMQVLNQSIGAQQCLAVQTSNPERSFRIGRELIRWDGIKPKKQHWLEEVVYQDVIRQGKAIYVENIKQELERREMDSQAQPPYLSLLALPLQLGPEILGVMMLAHENESFFQPEQKDLLEAGARQISIAVNNMTFVEYIREAAEEQGRMLREQQIESNRSKAILEAVADGVLVTDGENQIALMNKSAQEIFEISANDYLGKEVGLLGELIGQEESERSWLKKLLTWSRRTSEYRGETLAERIVLDNGRYLAVHAAPVFFTGGFLGTVSVFRDVTHEVQVDRMKAEFIANVSHELRTPITSIKGYVQVLLMGAAGEMNEQQRHFLDIVSSNTSRLTVLVNDLLDISRIETSRLSLLYQAVDLTEIAADVIADVRKRAQEEGKLVHIRLAADPDLPPVNGDRARLRQVLLSLVGNGYNYTPAGGEVVVSLKPAGGFVQVDVKDNGIGILPEEQGRIFERFYRGNDPLVLATAGTGLGLAIARTLVEMHQGKMWFESSGVRGEGSTFSFTLPASIEEK